MKCELGLTVLYGFDKSMPIASDPGITHTYDEACELLLSDDLIKHAATDAERKFYIAQEMSTLSNTFFTQAEFARFQQISVEALENGETLTADTPGDLWQDHMQQVIPLPRRTP